MTTQSADMNLTGKPSSTKRAALDPLHPRPQLQRAGWTSLDGEWSFAFDPKRRYERPQDIEKFTHTIRVPFAPESEKSGIGDTDFHPCVWYQREFTVPEGEGRVILHFGAVDYAAKVWVNDHFVTSHEGGHTPFHADITPYLEPGVQRVTVRAEDDPQDLAKPRGKQDWQRHPHSIWYPRTTGIWQTVWLERVAPCHLGRIRWEPHLERWEIGLEAFVVGEHTSDLTLKVRLSAGQQLLAEDTYTVINHGVHRRIALSDPGIDDFRNELLWSPEKPTLIDARLELWQGGKLIDQVASYTALRSVAIHRDRFMLNGRPYYLRLVLDQGYWSESLMTAPTDDAFSKDIQLIKSMGFNGVRKHQKIEDPRFYFWADHLGLVVWEEMPSAYRFTHDSVERIIREWTEVIDRDFSHPSIVVWVPFNESWGVPDLAEKDAHQNCVKALYHLTRALDSTRPVIGNDGWESSATDIIGIHDYDGNADRLAKRYEPGVNLEELLARRRPGGRVLVLDGHAHHGQPFMLTEFGGIAYTPPSVQSSAWGYSVSRSAVDLQKRYSALLGAVYHSELFSGFCYTQFTDTFQEANGLVYADRTPKCSVRAIRAATLGEPSPEPETLEVPTREPALLNS